MGEASNHFDLQSSFTSFCMKLGSLRNSIFFLAISCFVFPSFYFCLSFCFIILVVVVVLDLKEN